MHMAGERPIVQEILAAVYGSAGIMQVIAMKLGCTRETVARYIEKYPEVRQAFIEERESAIDFAEAAVLKAIQGDPASGTPPDVVTARWYLEQQGGSRGYGRRERLDIVAMNLDRLSDEQLQRIIRGEDPVRVTIESITSTNTGTNTDINTRFKPRSNAGAITVDGDFRDASKAEEREDDQPTDFVSKYVLG